MSVVEESTQEHGGSGGEIAPDRDLATVPKVNVTGRRSIARAVSTVLGIDPPPDLPYIIQRRENLVGRLTARDLFASQEAAQNGTHDPARRERSEAMKALVNSQPRVKFRLMDDGAPDGTEQQILRPFEPNVPTHIATIDSEGRPIMVAKDPSRWADEQARDSVMRAYAERDLTLDEMLPQRIRVAWRFVREWTRIKGLCGPDERLTEALKPNAMYLDPWQVPDSPWTPPRNRESNTLALLHPEVVAIIEKSELAEASLCYHRYDWDEQKWRAFPGLAVLPPPVPPRWWDADCDIADSYNIAEDLLLKLYVDLVRAITLRLYVEQGSEDDRDQGRHGLVGMLDPEMIRLVFPTRLQILTWEEILAQETLDLLITSSTGAAKKVLRRKYGLQDREIHTLVRLAIRQAQQETTGDTEENRSLMLLRLEDYIRRSRDALDLNSEMKGLKQASLVMGLGDSEKQDLFSGMIEAVRIAANDRRESRALAAEQRKLVENTATSSDDSFEAA